MSFIDDHSRRSTCDSPKLISAFIVNLIITMTIILSSCTMLEKLEGSPFSDARWKDEQLEVLVDNEVFVVEGMAGISMSDLREKARQVDPYWRTTILTELPELFAAMKLPIRGPLLVNLRNTKGQQLTRALAFNQRNTLMYLIHAYQHDQALDSKERVNERELLSAFRERGRKQEIQDQAIFFARADAFRYIDRLEFLLMNTFAYRDMRGVDTSAVIGQLRAELPARVPLMELENKIEKMVALYGDGHAGFMFNSMSQFRLPFSVRRTVEGWVISAKQASVCTGHPILEAIDDIPLELWLEQAKKFVPVGAAHSMERHALSKLKQLNSLRVDRGLPVSATARLKCSSLDGKRVHTMSVTLGSDGAERDNKWEINTLSSGIVHWKIPRMSATTADEVNKVMGSTATSKGLILDLRGNTGGRRDLLQALMPWFLEKEELYVSNFARVRLKDSDELQARDGYLTSRFLWPLDHSRFSRKEQAQIARYLGALPTDRAPNDSEWHVLAHRRSDNPDAGKYTAPVVVLIDEAGISAVDIFANAFKGRPQFTMMGRATRGASGRSDQHWFLHQEGLSLLKLSTMQSFRANGQSLDGQGVTPDVILALHASDVLGESDSELTAALSYLQKK